MPSLPHAAKWKDWVYRGTRNRTIDGLAALGSILEEFMDHPPAECFVEKWKSDRDRVVTVLEEHGLRYYRGGRVLPNDEPYDADNDLSLVASVAGLARPQLVDELFSMVVKGLPRAMHPLTHRRPGNAVMSFSSEGDVQDVLLALLRPWVADIRPLEFTPSYSGASTRMDLLLSAHGLVIALKFVRSRIHAETVSRELEFDIEHYRNVPECRAFWCVVCDPRGYLANIRALPSEPVGPQEGNDGAVAVRIFTLS